jgi:arylsulfatase A-like enzyme
MAKRSFISLAAGLTLLCACAGDELPPRPLPSTTPNIILIVLDTVRPDHLGSYGYERDTSPHIDSFAGEATLYTRAMAAAPWTVPTHASLFTGLYPFEHGAHTYKPYTTQGIVHPLHKSNLTLPEILRMGGYRTAAFVANSGFLHPFFQLDQGFESYLPERMYADKLNERVFEWLDDLNEIPFFLFINYMDAHRPYNTAERPGFIDPPAEQGGDALLSEFATIVLRGEEPFPEGLAGKVIDQYDTAIANLDESLGVLMERLRALRIYDRSLIVITSDHGEYFGEHQLVEHSKDIYQEVIRVPLVVKAPNQRSAERSDSLISSTHMPRLILSHTPQEIFGKFLSLYPDPQGEPVIAENYYTRAAHLFAPRFGHRFFRVRTALFDWPYKYIHSSDGSHELYDLDADPAEAVDLVEIEVETAERLGRELAEFKERRLSTVRILREEDLVDEDDLELQERLRALGYIASSRR